MHTEKIYSEINTIVLDIDGTILNSNNIVQDGLPEVIKKLDESECNIILASARPISSMVHLGDKLGITCPLVGLNGGIVAHKDTIYWGSEFIVNPAILGVLSHHKQQISINYYYNFEWVVYRMDDDIRKEGSLSWVQPTIDENYIPTYLHKILLIGEPGILSQISKELEKLNLNCAFSKHNYLEVTPLGVNKVAGIIKALEFIGNSHEIGKVMAIGDGENDIPMLVGFDYGVAMGNAPSLVQQKAAKVIDSCDDNGLAKFLESFHTLKSMQK
jgi:Cof subfamily protein (haloacid dehalogenase superfamily)